MPKTSTSARTIVRAISVGSKTYRAGDEDVLAAVLAPEQLARLVQRGALAGEWVPESEAPENAPEEGGDEGAPLPKVRELKAYLETLASAEDVAAMQARDERPSAQPIYEARLAALDREG